MARKGKQLPDWIQDAPELLPSEVFYMQAFWELSTTRQVGMAPGPIPWTATQKYTEVHGLDNQAAALMHRVVRALDGAYLGYQEKERKKEQERAEQDRSK